VAAPKILPRPGGRCCAKNPAAPRGGVAAPKILPTENSPCPPASRFILYKEKINEKINYLKYNIKIKIKLKYNYYI
jgi:hypothetical protein